jgi:hypothetical protein
LFLIFDPQGIDISTERNPPASVWVAAFDDYAAALRAQTGREAHFIDEAMEMQAALSLLAAWFGVGVEMTAERDQALHRFIYRGVDFFAPIVCHLFATEITEDTERNSWHQRFPN